MVVEVEVEDMEEDTGAIEWVVEVDTGGMEAVWVADTGGMEADMVAVWVVTEGVWEATAGDMEWAVE